MGLCDSLREQQQCGETSSHAPFAIASRQTRHSAGGPDARGVQADAKATGFERRSVIELRPAYAEPKRPPDVIGAFRAGFQAPKAALFLAGAEGMCDATRRSARRWRSVGSCDAGAGGC